LNKQPLDDLAARLERERQEADRLYNDALTAVDRAIQAAPAPAAAPPPFDPSRLPDVNRHWDILPSGAPAFDGSLKGRLRAFVWRLVGPALETQKQFNVALVDHLNRNASADVERPRTTARALDAISRELDALVRFESRLVQYLQTITAYVDTKDRSLGASELVSRVALAEQRILALKRDVESLASQPGISDGSARRAPQPSAGEPFAGAVDSLTYVGFEDRFRGSRGEIGSRVEGYVPIFAGAAGVVDLGCGRGELLLALKARGIQARGVDANEGMVELCRSQGLDVERGDALGFLQKQKDGEIGGLAAIQVVEHFEPAYLLRVLETAFHKMRPGAPLLVETINPACWMAFFETYIRDLTHQRPLHPDTLRYLVQASGFSAVDVHFRQPVGEDDRLKRAATGLSGSDEVSGLAAAINDHADKLNARLFSSMDYAVIARR
jgi:SAM-dependent methyltransferase